MAHPLEHPKTKIAFSFTGEGGGLTSRPGTPPLGPAGGSDSPKISGRSPSSKCATTSLVVIVVVVVDDDDDDDIYAVLHMKLLHF